MIITNSRYALVGYFITSYPTRAHGIIVIYTPKLDPDGCPLLLSARARLHGATYVSQIRNVPYRKPLYEVSAGAKRIENPSSAEERGHMLEGELVCAGSDKARYFDISLSFLKHESYASRHSCICDSEI